ncbi:MAG: hypothetical protein P4M13_08840 [Alphaproteobacteria bacterium]|nr:hypothetical protein [Alphaproteobacteria bacterium]
MAKFRLQVGHNGDEKPKTYEGKSVLDLAKEALGEVFGKDGKITYGFPTKIGDTSEVFYSEAGRHGNRKPIGIVTLLAP